MKKLRSTKLSTKLIISFIIMGLLNGFIALAGNLSLNQLNLSYQHVFTDSAVTTSELERVDKAFQKARIHLQQMLIADSQDEIKAIYTDMTDKKNTADDFGENFNQYIVDDKMQEALDYFNQVATDYTNAIKKSLTLIFNNQIEEARVYVKSDEFTQITTNLETAITTLKEERLTYNDEQYKLNIQYTRVVQLLIFIASILSVLFASYFGFVLIRSITRPIRELVHYSNEVAKGNLAVDMEIHPTGELGVLASAFENMSNNINHVLSSIHMTSKQVENSSR